ncbi:MAG TPA: glycine--tRNA ligase subunit beta [Gammaproteobacteria bacterium]
MERKDFLVEIGTEELPPKALRSLAESFRDGVMNSLFAGDAERELRNGIRDFWYCSPRRLALVLQNVPLATPDAVQERLGPAIQAAFDRDGKPTKAAEGFAASNGTTVEQLARKQTDKGERLAFDVTVPGKRTSALLPGIVEDALRKLPIPKRMRWGAGEAEFVRPVQWIVMLLGNEVIDCEILGVPSGRTSFGHRFHSPGPVDVRSPAEYAAVLEKAHVRVNDSTNSLAEWIGEQVNSAARELGGVALGAEQGSALLDEVAALNEWPVPVVGSIPERFMELPEEVLTTTIETHQRYFPVRGSDGKLLPRFITFANIESKNPDVVRKGNERVVAPRLEDAMFFWNTDRRTSLAERVATLDHVTFQKELGSYGDKVRRVTALAGIIAGGIGGDVSKAERAAQLSKADLVTDMVFEFTELQGVMGRYYARHDGEHEEVADAIFEQYLPRFAGDVLPATRTGQALAIADKLDTICGIFSIGQKPSGSKDPFALRRLALGLLRIVIEGLLDLDIVVLIKTALEHLPTGKTDVESRHALTEFFFDRLKTYYLEQGVRGDVFEAVRSREPGRPLDFDRRVKAVQAFMQREEAAALAAANKRISNILRKAETKVSSAPDPALFESDDERALATAVADKSAAIAPLLEQGRYEAALAELAGLRPIVDTFFDAVMVMAEDPKVRDNRLKLLNELRSLFNHTADFAEIQVDG